MNRTQPTPSSPSLTPLLRDDETDLSTPAHPALNWDQLRREARQLENEIDLKLAALSKITPNDDKSGPEMAIEDLLKKVKQSVFKAKHSVKHATNNQSFKLSLTT